MYAIVVQLAGSLAAIMLITLLSWKLELGGGVRIRGEEDARRLAKEAFAGFHAIDVGIDSAGLGALLRDTQGRVLVLRRHGAHFVARLLGNHDSIRLNHHCITVTTPERSFGVVTLDLGERAPVWSAILERLGGRP